MIRLGICVAMLVIRAIAKTEQELDSFHHKILVQLFHWETYGMYNSQTLAPIKLEVPIKLVPITLVSEI